MNDVQKRNRALRYVVLAAVLAVVPAAVTPYTLDTMSSALALGIFAVSIDLLWGYTGILNLGPAAAFGLGGYAIGLGLRHLGVGAGTLVGLLGALVLPVILAVVVGYAGFRLRVSQIYYALITLAVAMVFEDTVRLWSSVTGGSNGLTGVPRPAWSIGSFVLDFSPNVRYYYLVVVVTLIALWFAERLVRSRLGSVLVAIRENEVKVLSLGYSVTTYKVTVTAIAAALGGLAGALFVPVVGIAYPALFAITLSLQGFVWVAIGGQGTLWGPFIAAVVLTLLQSFLAGSFATAYVLILGLLFIIIVKFAPGGVAGYIQRLASRRRTVSPTPHQASAGR